MKLDTFQFGEPQELRGIVVTPVFPRLDPVATYVTLDEALSRGLEITETSDAGHVPEVGVQNPLPENVLLYDGEELLGAKQNRILNITVLAPAKSTLTIPVSCVEQGRWAQHSRSFAAARHISNTNLRRRKANALVARPLARGIAQGEVWDEVRATAERLQVFSPTGANSDAFEVHATRLAELEDAFPAAPGQCGALLGLGSSLCLDVVSRPDAFASLWPKLRRGYMLDALYHLGGEATASQHIPMFLGEIADAPVTRQPSAGLGDDLRFRSENVIGSGLELDGEVVQLSAFTSHESSPRSVGRISRPSRRH